MHCNLRPPDFAPLVHGFWIANFALQAEYFPCYTSTYGGHAFSYTSSHVLPENLLTSTLIIIFMSSVKTFLCQQITHLMH